MKVQLHKLRHLPWLLLPALIWFALRDLSLADIQHVLSLFGLIEILVFIGLNILILFLFSSRWWLILRAQGKNVPISSLVGFRLAGFSISYFTPGTQIGGEPLQVRLLQKHTNLQSSVALASVSLDKLFELVTNFTFLAIGTTIILSTGLLHKFPIFLGIAFFIISLVLPIAYLFALRAGFQPVGWLLSHNKMNNSVTQHFIKLSSLVLNTEKQIGKLFIEKPLRITCILLSSVIIWIAMIVEYWLLLEFLGASLNIPQTIIALTAARLAFLTPLPGGFGALEASQTLAIQALGFDPAIGISAGLLIRARDVGFGLAGLGLIAILSRKYRSSSIPAPNGD